MLEPHTSLFAGAMGVGKTHLVLDLLEREYFDHFDFTVILCPMLQYNETYRPQQWFNTGPHIIQIEPSNCLYDWIEKISNLLAGSETLFLINDIIADETLDKRRQPLLYLAISG